MGGRVSAEGNSWLPPVELTLDFARSVASIRASSAMEVVAPPPAGALGRFPGMRTVRATPFRSAAMNSWMVSRRRDVIRSTESFRGSGNGAWRPTGTRRPAGIGYLEFGRRTKAAWSRSRPTAPRWRPRRRRTRRRTSPTTGPFRAAARPGYPGAPRHCRLGAVRSRDHRSGSVAAVNRGIECTSRRRRRSVLPVCCGSCRTPGSICSAKTNSAISSKTTASSAYGPRVWALFSGCARNADDTATPVSRHFVDQQQAVAVALFADSDDASTSLPGSCRPTDPHAERGRFTVNRSYRYARAFQSCCTTARFALSSSLLVTLHIRSRRIGRPSRAASG
jgi:hypothetical protein